MYDAQVGRFFTQDAFADKFYPLSPYSYCANVPVLLTDITGNDWTISIGINGDGKWFINISFTGSILNSSSNQDIDAEAYKTRLTSEFTNLFNKTNAADATNGLSEMQITTTVDINVIRDKRELKSNAHLIEIVNDDDRELNQGEKQPGKISYGRAINGKRVLLNEKAFTEEFRTDGYDVQNALHEIGHTAGLDHPGHGKDANFRQATPKQTNFMGVPRYKYYPDNRLFTTTGPTTEQVKLIYKLYSARQLNSTRIRPQFSRIE
jgi:hypothetical protein